MNLTKSTLNSNLQQGYLQSIQSVAAGKEKTDESKKLSHEEWSQTSCSVLIR